MAAENPPAVLPSEQAALSGALLGNSYRGADPWVDSTGLRSHSLRHRTLSGSNDPRIAEEFLVNSRLRRGDRETDASIQSYFFDAGLTLVGLIGTGEDGAAVPLASSIRLTRDVDDVVARRRSRRQYTGDSIGADYLATMVRGAGGVTAEVLIDLPGGGEARLRLRAAPSGGGLYPVHLYVAALRVSDLDRFLYRYDPIRDVLIRCAGVDGLLDACVAMDDLISLSRAAAVFLFVGQPWRSLRKYGPRGLRFVFLEAGASRAALREPA